MRNKNAIEKEKLEKVNDHQRDNSIDFFRGLAALWIIFIHTCFFSGASYVSPRIQTLSLFVDVPLFVFISGMSFNFNSSFIKSLKNLVKIWYKWLLFLPLFFVVQVINEGTKVLSIDNILKTIFFSPSGFVNQSVYYSIWFVFMFFVVTIIGNSIICIYKKNNDKLDNFKYVLMFLFIMTGMKYYINNDYSVYLIFDTNIYMYTFFYCLGFYLYNFKMKSFKTLLLCVTPIIAILTLLFLYSPYHFTLMQAAKMNRHFTYFVYSSISILLVTYLKDRVKIKRKNIICFVGRNALLFYFCQALATSLAYYIVPYVIDLPGTIGIVYIINVCTTSIFVMILYFTDKLLSKIKLPKITLFEEK